MIYIGDCHGKTPQFTWMLKHGMKPEYRNKQYFQLGDMGLGFRGVHLEHLDQLQFIRGNHDDPAICKVHPCYAGEYGYIPEEELFFLGGAWSIDAKWRTEGISWWRDEEQSIEELNKAHQLYLEVKPRIVATHEAPTVAALTMLNNLMIPLSKDDSATSVVKGEEYSYYKAKLGCVNTRTSQALQQMFEAHKPEHWVFGHYHVEKDFEVEGTQFHCLPELMAKEFVLDPVPVAA